MKPMAVTFAVFQPEMSWLNAVAFKNMPPMAVTFAVFQPPMSWLNAVALANMPPMVVTFAVFQEPMRASLNCVQPANISAKVVTLLVVGSDAGHWIRFGQLRNALERLVSPTFPNDRHRTSFCLVFVVVAPVP